MLSSSLFSTFRAKLWSYEKLMQSSRLYRVLREQDASGERNAAWMLLLVDSCPAAGSRATSFLIIAVSKSVTYPACIAWAIALSLTYTRRVSMFFAASPAFPLIMITKMHISFIVSPHTWWWLFPRLRGFWENARPLFLKWILACAH